MQKELEKKANIVRQHVINMILKAGSGHPAGSLGMADVFSALYFSVMRHNPKKPKWKERDRLILSNGHICPARYAAMAESGYLPVKELWSLRKFGSRLQGHPEYTRFEALETTSGPLGSGLSQACGMAYVAKYLDKKSWRVYCVMSDGEHDEGQTWEAVLFAAKNKLDNLTAIIDRNQIQIDGRTEDVMPLESLKEKYEAFHWKVLEIDGHNIEEIIRALKEAKDTHNTPTVIIAHTIPGKGVSFMENKFEWHGKAPSKEEAAKAIKELKKIC